MSLNKNLLIISPYFPPSNAADMQRIRMSLPYFKEFSWDAEVVTVNPIHSEMTKDYLLNESISESIKIHFVEAFNKKWTSKLGLGSLAIRSLWFYKEKVNTLLKTKRYDLIYFSTTQFPICILGAYWKWKFGIPYVIDMQDPWHSDYYKDKHKSERPPKYWFSYRFNKYLEPIAMKKVDGLIAVSKPYLDTLIERYPVIKNIPQAVITFGAFHKDFEIVKQHVLPLNFRTDKGVVNFVYVGVAGHIMSKALTILFKAIADLLNKQPNLKGKFMFNFIGTDYAPAGRGRKTVLPIAERFGVQDLVSEQTDRVGFYQALNNIAHADALIMPGSDNADYTASKLYPYILADKPLLAVFHPKSSVVNIMHECNAGTVVTLDMNFEKAGNIIEDFISKVLRQEEAQMRDWQVFEEYSARLMTKGQCAIFDSVHNSR